MQQLPIKAHYATLAMLAMAERHQAGEQVPARVIAKEHQIPQQFLVQILQLLRASGLIDSTRGPNGGFRLARAPVAINIAEIVDAVCATTTSPTQIADESAMCRSVNEFWDEVQQRQRQLLEKVSLDDLLTRLESPANSMFYI